MSVLFACPAHGEHTVPACDVLLTGGGGEFWALLPCFQHTLDRQVSAAACLAMVRDGAVPALNEISAEAEQFTNRTLTRCAACAFRLHDQCRGARCECPSPRCTKKRADAW